MKAVLCDDHLLFLETLAMVMRSQGHDVVETRGPQEAVDAVRSDPPDLCVMDLHFADDGDDTAAAMDAINTIRRESSTRVLVLTGQPPLLLRRQLQDADVPVLEKSTRLESLLHATERVAAGDTVTSKPAPTADRTPTRTWNPASLADFLTAREVEVLEGLVNGDSTATLATRLGVRPATARTHVQKLLDKLCVHSRLEAVALAIRYGLVELE